MALLSLGETKWRMIRMALKKKRFVFKDCRRMARKDAETFLWLLNNGFFAYAPGSTPKPKEKVKGGAVDKTPPEAQNAEFVVTQKGKEAADLGEYEVEFPRLPVRDV